MDEISKKTDPPVDPLEINIGAPTNGISDGPSGSDPPEKDASDLGDVTGRSKPVAVHHLDSAKPLDPSTYPNHGPGDNGTKLPATIPNLMHMLVGYGINVRYNVIDKKLEIRVPGASGCPDNADNSALVRILVIPITGSGFIRSPDLPSAMCPIVSL